MPSDTRPRGRRTSGSLTETRVRDWQYLPERHCQVADERAFFSLGAERPSDLPWGKWTG